MQPSAHEVPSKTPDVHFVGPDVTITPMECPLLMLWTAPPPARECRGYGCG